MLNAAAEIAMKGIVNPGSSSLTLLRSTLGKYPTDKYFVTLG